MPFSAKRAIISLSLALSLLTVPLIASAQGYADDELLGGPLSAPAAHASTSEDTLYGVNVDVSMAVPYEEVIYVEEVIQPAPPPRTETETAPAKPGQRQLSWQGRNNY
jgi:hypothetical protein